MKKILRILSNRVLYFFGLRIIRIYEFEHLSQKYTDLINEVQNFFKEKIFHDFSVSEKRTYLLANLYGTQVCEALYLLQYLHISIKLSGDVCEFGCANGATSALIANEIITTDKNLWLFDSFQGLSKPSKKDILINDIFHLDSMKKYYGAMKYSKEEVRGRLKNVFFPESRTRVIAGFIENTIVKKKLPKKICFAFVDFDLYNPIRVALNYLDKYLVSGGHILIDDYNFFSLGAKKAVDEFYQDHKKNYKLLFPHKFAGNFCILKKIK